MRIVYVLTRSDSVGGASIHVRDLARAMRESGHHVTVLLGGRGPVTDQLSMAGVPVRSLRFLERRIHPIGDLRAFAEIKAMLRALKPDLVSAHTAKAGWLARAACARLGIPVVYTPHGWPIGNRISAPAGALFTVAERLASRWASAIICVCENEKRLALHGKVAPAEKLHVVHNGVRDIPAELRADPAQHPVRISSVARFESPKDHVTLLRALATLREQPWQLDLIGDGPLEPQIRDLGSALGLASRIRFAGYHPDPGRALAGAQLFVLASRSEGFPRSVLEAMRAGLPVIASDVGGVSEAVRNGITGLLTPPRKHQALAAALRILLASSDKRKQMGAAGRAAFESSFRLETMLESTLAIYATVLDRAAQSRNIVEE